MFRCPNCFARVTRRDDGYWICQNWNCGEGWREREYKQPPEWIIAEEDWSEMTEAEALISIGAKPAVRDGKLGLEIDGVFIPAADEGECPDFVVGGTGMEYAVKGSRDVGCSDCGGPCVLAPTGQELLLGCPNTRTICSDCMFKRLEQDK